MPKEHPIIQRECQGRAYVGEKTRALCFRSMWGYTHCLRCGMMASTGVLACSYQLHECTSTDSPLPYTHTPLSPALRASPSPRYHGHWSSGPSQSVAPLTSEAHTHTHSIPDEVLTSRPLGFLSLSPSNQWTQIIIT